MKKLLIIPFLALFIFSCDDSPTFDYNGGQTAYLFSRASSDLIATNTSVTTIEIPVGVTTKSNVDRTIAFIVDPTSTATAAMYTIDQSTLVIPAGSFSTMVKLSGNFSAIPASGTAVLTLKFDGTALSGSDVHTVNMTRFCTTALAGNYNVTTTYGFHDFLPNYASNTMTTAITSVGVNTYKVADFSGGLYAVGGAYDAPYGTGTAAASTRDLTFVINCGDLSWTGESDLWGTIVAQPTGVNSYNAANGVITISWYCNGYGENGVSVYTPAN